MAERPGILRRNVRSRRELVGLTQETLAVKAGITRSTVARIEGEDGYMPRLSSLEAIAAVLECSVVDLLSEPGEPQPSGEPETRAS